MGFFDNIANKVAQQIAPKVTLGGPSFAKPAPTPAGLPVHLQPLSLLGGVSLAKARQIQQRVANTDYARKNLWFISVANVTPLNLPFEAAGAAMGAITSGDFFSVDTLASAASAGAAFLNWSNFDFNLFATDVSYAPVTLNSDSTHVGGAAFTTLTGRELVELRVTTLDDQNGTLKNWFRKKAALMVFPNGAIGLPITYLLKIRVTHGYISDEVDGIEAAYFDEFVMKPVSIDTDLSRREDGLQEIHMTFQQFDNFTQLT